MEYKPLWGRATSFLKEEGPGKTELRHTTLARLRTHDLPILLKGSAKAAVFLNGRLSLPRENDEDCFVLAPDGFEDFTPDFV